MSTIPWVEKYRPTKLDNVVLSETNKHIMYNIIEKNYFPNILFYGPPGTGKTTTIINLLNAYQKKYNQENKELIIHLNASDERGIDIIRNQIQQFINSKNMFNKGLKFVVLDEVDYMTKVAQQALRHLMQNYNNNVRFCLICNYISKIDENLQNEFLKLRVNELPRENVITFLKEIVDKEKLKISNEKIEQIQTFYKSDIRSMVNFLQSNQENTGNVVSNNLWENLLITIKRSSEKEINININEITINYNIDKKSIIKEFFNFLITEHKEYISSRFLDFVENILHSNEIKTHYLINYFIEGMKKFVKN